MFKCFVCSAACWGAQITSLFLHFFPACVAWTERWHTGRHTRTRGSAFSQLDPEPRGWADASFTEVVLFPMVPYLAWAVLYYAKVRPLLPVLCIAEWVPAWCCSPRFFFVFLLGQGGKDNLELL